jgi:hypothetical protein
MNYTFEELFQQVDSTNIPFGNAITMDQAKYIVERNEGSNIKCINDAFKLGYINALKLVDEAVSIIQSSKSSSATKSVVKASNYLSDASYDTEKAKAILCDLWTDYQLSGDQPTKSQTDRLGFEAKKILTFISIAIDYVDNVLKKIDEAQEQLNN